MAQQLARPDSPDPREFDPAIAQLVDPTTPMPNPATDLMPGESRLDTIWNPYYGEVEAGTPPLAYLAFLPIPNLTDVQGAIDQQRMILDGEMQTRIEVLTGKRFQQKDQGARPKEEVDRIKKGREEREREQKRQDEERKAQAERQSGSGSSQSRMETAHDDREEREQREKRERQQEEAREARESKSKK